MKTKANKILKDSAMLAMAIFSVDINSKKKKKEVNKFGYIKRKFR